VVTVKASSRPSDDVVLQLAYERIDILETELTEFHGEREAMEIYKGKEGETTEELIQMNGECRRLQKELKRVRSLFQKLRNKLSASVPRLEREKGRTERSSFVDDDADKSYNEFLDIIYDALQTHEGKSKYSSKKNASMFPIDTEDSGDDDATQPVWAGDIMEDLAIIAAGDVPASLRITPKRPPINPNVFVRLTDPDNFTGVQKSTFLHKEDQSSHTSGSESKYSRKRTNRSSSNTPQRSDDQSIVSAASGTDSRYSRNSSVRKGSIRSDTHLMRSRAFTPKQSSMKIPAHFSPTKKSAATGPPREVSLPAGKEMSFVKAYTQTDVFERLQKKVTNSYELRRDEENTQRQDNSST